MDALLLAIFALIVILPLLLTWKGIGSRWIWLGGGIVFLLIGIAWSMRNLRWGVEPKGEMGFDPMPDYTGEMYAEALFLVAFMFLLAGLLFRPKREPSTSLLGNHEGRILNAGRANG
jgi:hypothetical protein